MPNKTVLDYVEIDAERINVVCEAYFKWKSLNDSIKNISHRGINMPESISEPMGCFCLGFLWNRGSVAGDATDLEQHKKIEFKATSNFKYDLTSFGPTTYFDELYFLRFNIEDNKVFIYNLGVNSEEFKAWPVSKTKTIGEYQAAGKRPHVRIIEEHITPQGLQPVVVFDIRRMQVIEDNR